MEESFNDLIKSAKFRRNRIVITFALLIPYFMCFYLLFPEADAAKRSLYLDVVAIIAMLFPFVFYAYCITMFSKAKCPSCGKQVFVKKKPLFFTYSNPFSGSCLNCGLELKVKE
jgi:hypothetical protein